MRRTQGQARGEREAGAAGATRSPCNEPPKKVAILILTVDEPTNAALWRQWREAVPDTTAGETCKHRCTFYVNSKNLFSGHGILQRVRNPVTDTAWGEHTLVRAHQALLREALDNDANNEWFCLVSGDAVPTVGLPGLLERLDRLEDGDSLLDSYHVHATTVFDAVSMYIHTRLAENPDTDNWWVRDLAVSGEDEEGPYRAICKDWVDAHSQFCLLSRIHARILADMPEKVARDFDSLIPRSVAHLFPAADEIVPYTFLAWWLRTHPEDQPHGGRLLQESIMFAPVGKDGVHATLHTRGVPRERFGAFPKWYFARKFETLNGAHERQLHRLWITRRLLL